MSSLFARDDTQEDWGMILITTIGEDGVERPAQDVLGFDLSGVLVTDPPYGDFQEYQDKYIRGIGQHRTFADGTPKVDVGPRTRDSLAFWGKLRDNTGP